MVNSLQRRYLELALVRQQSPADHAFHAGMASGANEMLKRIDGVLAEATRTGDQS